MINLKAVVSIKRPDSQNDIVYKLKTQDDV